MNNRKWLRALFAGSLCVLVGGAGIPTIDASSIAQRTLQQAQTMVQWAEQHGANARTLAELQAHLRQAQAAYAAITGVRDLGSAMAALNLLGIQNPLPVDPRTVQSLISGSRDPAGMASALSGLLGTAVNSNRVYAPTGNDFRSQEMAAAAQGLAGVQALSQQAYQAASDRLRHLSQVRARLATAKDPKEVQDLTAALVLLQNEIASQDQQSNAVSALAQAQVGVRAQREEEYERMCIDRLVEYYAGRLSNPECRPPAPSSTSSVTAGASGTSGSTPVMAGAGVGVAPAGSSRALDTMLSRPWGEAAVANANRVGVNPSSLAATCVIESGCRDVAARPGSTINGAFQMTDDTEKAAFRAATGTATLSTDPAGQSLAAAQELRNAALSLQRSGVPNPTTLDARTIYQWGAGAGPALARADNNTLMSAALPAYSAANLRANGIDPAKTTVGQWRADVATKLGDAANQPVLTATTRRV